MLKSFISLKRIFFRLLKSPRLIILAIFIFFVLLGSSFIYMRQRNPLGFYKKYHREVQFIKKLIDVVYWPQAMFSSSQLAKYELIISSKDLDFLNNNLPETYANNFLTSEYRQEVSGTLKVAGKEYEVKVRYRGDTDVHWRDPKKSWLITFKNDYLEGQKEIHLIIPDDRLYLIEEFNFYRARKFGLVTPPSKFVNLFVNGESYGVYWQFEGWGKEMLEKQNVPGDINLYGGVDAWDERWQGMLYDRYDSLYFWHKFSKDLVTEVNNYSDLKHLLDIIDNPDDEYFKKHIGQILDLDSFYQWHITSYLVVGAHQGGANARFYFNPTKGKFEFMPWDVALGDLPPPLLETRSLRLEDRILMVPEFLHERNKLLWQYVGNDQNLADDLNYYEKLDKLTKNDFYKDFKKVDDNLTYRRKVGEYKDKIIGSFNYIKENLKNATGEITVTLDDKLPGAVVKMTATGFNAVDLAKVTIKQDNCENKIKIYQDVNGDNKLNQGDRFVADFSCAQNVFTATPNFVVYSAKDNSDPAYLRPKPNSSQLLFIASQPFDTKKIKDKDFDFTLLNAVTGEKATDLSVKFVVDNLNFNFQSLNLSPIEFTRNNSFFRLMDNNLILGPGNYTFNNDVIIPADTHLIIKPGTTLNMASGVSIMSYSPISAVGTAKEPIIFQGINKIPWGTLSVIGVQSTSTLEYLRMENGKNDYINGTFMSGMLSIYWSPVVIKNSKFSLAHGDDSVNIKYGFAEISKNVFANNDFDGLDFDVTNSIVESNLFLNNGNDGLDISSAKPILKNNKVSNSGDKCISLGEKTEAVVFNNLLTNCNIGIASKDASRPLIINNIIMNNKSGLEFYEKKKNFGGAGGQVVNSIIWGNKKGITLDDKSRVDIIYSDIQDNWPGEGNVSQTPEMTSDFQLTDDSPLRGAGTKKYLEVVLSLEDVQKLQTVPLGVIK